MADLLRQLATFQGRVKILHLSWMAFLISFVVWFNHAPLMLLIQQDLHLSNREINIILLLNVALTIPARLLTGLLVDRYGARRCFSALLALGSIPCFMFALADSFAELAWARFLLGSIGAGFVVGIRIIGDWFPARQMGIAEGIYAGWGNCGSAVAALLLPGLALLLDDEHGWRYAVAITGLLALVFAWVYFRQVVDVPEQRRSRLKGSSAILEVSSVRDLFVYIVAIIPLYASLSLLVWHLGSPHAPLLSLQWQLLLHALIWSLFFYHAYKVVDLNADRLGQPLAIIHHYRMSQVLALGVLYLVTFGSKLAVVSMLPIFFYQTFSETQHMSLVQAGVLAALFVLLNVVARPMGGWLSDRYGRKLSLYALCSGLTLSYASMALIDSDWSVTVAVVVTLTCSFFLQGAEGAVFAMVPLVKRSMTGQIAGVVGAFGNAGAIVFLVLLSFVPAGGFFWMLALCSAVAIPAVYYLIEPKSVITQIMADGSLAVIELD